MKKRIKFRLRNDLALPFWIAISICLMGALTNSLLFKQSFFRALEKLNEEPIATITFKYKKIHVPASLVKTVKAQQHVLLNRTELGIVSVTAQAKTMKL